MPELHFVKTFGRLEPCDALSTEYLSKLSIGEMITAKIRKPRNGRFHRKMFALLQLGFENQDAFESFDDWRRAVTIEAGFFVDRRMWDGSHMREAKSLSYAEMDELEFGKLFEAAAHVIAKFIGTDDETVAREIDQFLVVGAR